MARRQKHLLVEIADLPWWVGAALAGIVYVSLKFVFPALGSKSPVVQGIAAVISPAAWIFAVPFIVAAIVSAIRQFFGRRRFDKQTSIESIRELSWQQFEQLVAEAFRRQGYVVEEVGGGGADGGIDLLLFKSGTKTVVQCKRWKNIQIDVSRVRELFGVMTAEGANEAIFVSSGEYTKDAIEFANGKAIQLIDGSALLKMIRAVQQIPVNRHPSPIIDASLEVPSCPKCMRPMVKRTARKGANAGQEFWGCPAYPQCRGTRSTI